MVIEPPHTADAFYNRRLDNAVHAQESHIHTHAQQYHIIEF